MVFWTVNILEVHWNNKGKGKGAAGGGKKKSIVETFAAERDLPNVVIAPYQPREKLDASVKADGDGARADMLADGNLLYVFGDSGKLIAYEVSAKGG